MAGTDAERDIAKMEAEIVDLRKAVGALIVCLVRVGVQGRAPFFEDQEALGLPSRMGHVGIPPPPPGSCGGTLEKRRRRKTSDAQDDRGVKLLTNHGFVDEQDVVAGARAAIQNRRMPAPNAEICEEICGEDYLNPTRGFGFTGTAFTRTSGFLRMQNPIQPRSRASGSRR